MQVPFLALGRVRTGKSLCMLLQSYATIAIVPNSGRATLLYAIIFFLSLYDFPPKGALGYGATVCYYRGDTCIEYAIIEVCL